MCFVKAPSLIHYPLKIYHFRLYVVEKKGFGAVSRQCGFVPNQVLMQKNLSFLVSKTLTCALIPLYLRMH